MGEVCDDEMSDETSEKSRSDEAIESSIVEGARAMLGSPSCRVGSHGAGKAWAKGSVCLQRGWFVASNCRKLTRWQADQES